MEELLVWAETNIGLFIFGFFLFAIGLATIEFIWEWR